MSSRRAGWIPKCPCKLQTCQGSLRSWTGPEASAAYLWPRAISYRPNALCTLPFPQVHGQETLPWRVKSMVRASECLGSLTLLRFAHVTHVSLATYVKLHIRASHWTGLHTLQCTVDPWTAGVSGTGLLRGPNQSWPSNNAGLNCVGQLGKKSA